MTVARLQVPPRAKRGEIVEVRVAIQHPMETGFRRDSFGVAIPKNTINTLICHYNGVEVFRAEMGSGITANPYLQFTFVADVSGTVDLDWVDDRGEKGAVSARIDVTA